MLSWYLLVLPNIEKNPVAKKYENIILMPKILNQFRRTGTLSREATVTLLAHSVGNNSEWKEFAPLGANSLL